MAVQKPGKLVTDTPMVLFSQAALLPLDQIWLWNAEAHGRDHARTYVAFLVAEAGKLGGDSGVGHHLGRPVPNLPHLRYVVIRRRARGHGHLAVFQQIRDAIVVLQF